MNRSIPVLLVAIFASCGIFLTTNRTSSSAGELPPDPSCWVAISVSQPLFRQGRTKNLQIYFTLVNEGNKPIKPQIDLSKLVINGKELADSAWIFGNGIRDSRWEALPPGDAIEFTYALGAYFEKPGIYEVSWKGPGFESPKIVFRVLQN